jgi:hypothetical protein
MSIARDLWVVVERHDGELHPGRHQLSSGMRVSFFRLL